MAITRERFEQGMTYDEYKAQMTQNQERFATNERNFTLDPADLAAFKALPQTYQVLVLAEDWCGDVINNLPVMGRIAADSGKFNLRIFLRDQNLDIMDQYLNQGQFRSIPVFVFFDDAFNEVGHFIERPASVTARNDAMRREAFAAHPEFGSPDTPITQLPEEVRTKLQQAMAEQRAASKPLDNKDVVQEVLTIVSKTQA